MPLALTCPARQRRHLHSLLVWLCRALRELPSAGKSGSVFFLSDDDRFMIKTVRSEEMKLLLELVPAYYQHCKANPDTLLTRFYGVHRVKPLSGPKVLPSDAAVISGCLNLHKRARSL